MQKRRKRENGRFTIHFATINTKNGAFYDLHRTNLQYTLLLLIPYIKSINIYDNIAFTIHFATINTNSLPVMVHLMLKFTIHFATINTFRCS